MSITITYLGGRPDPETEVMLRSVRRREVMVENKKEIVIIDET